MSTTADIATTENVGPIGLGGWLIRYDRAARAAYSYAVVIFTYLDLLKMAPQSIHVVMYGKNTLVHSHAGAGRMDGGRTGQEASGLPCCGSR